MIIKKSIFFVMMVSFLGGAIFPARRNLLAVFNEKIQKSKKSFFFKTKKEKNKHHTTSARLILCETYPLLRGFMVVVSIYQRLEAFR